MKNILLISSSLLVASALSASNIKPIIGIEVGAESGSVKEDYRINSGYGSFSMDETNDYSGTNFRISGGVAIVDSDLEHRIKLFFETASGEIEYDFGDVDADSKEIGISYDLVFGTDKLKPFVGVELSSGSTDVDLVDLPEDLDYVGFGLYAGLAYELTDNLDLTGRLGYKLRNYDTVDYYSGPYNISLETEQSGADMKVGLLYKF